MENNPNQKSTIDTKVETKSHLDKLAEVFLPEDLESMGNNIMNTVVVPTILKSAGDILVRSIDMIFGTNYSNIRSAQQSQTSVPYVSYGNPSSLPPAQKAPQQPSTMQVISTRRGGVYDYNTVKFRSIDDATMTLNNMRAIIQSTGYVTIGWYMEFTGNNTNPEDFNYGWTNLTTVSLQRTGDEMYPYKMLLPSPMPIKSQFDKIYI